MKKLSFSLVCILAAFILIYDDLKLIAASSIQKRATDMYTTKYDNIDIDTIIASRRLMQNYVNCLLDKGPCTPEGKELKTYLPDAITTKCAKCSEKQKKITGTVLVHLQVDFKDLFDQLLDRYDHDGTIRAQYEEEDDVEDEEEK